MPVTYQPAPPDVVAMAREIAEKHHPHLIEHEVKIDIVMAYGPVNDDNERTGPALMLHGYRAWGVASITKLKERVKGDGDCEIALDGDVWPQLSDLERRALVDHELTHFDMLEGEDGQRYDDLGRPMLSMRLHDYDVGFFHSIAERYGPASVEIMNFKSLMEGHHGAIYKAHMESEPAQKPKDKRASKKQREKS